MKNEIHCPYCGSDNVRRQSYSGAAFALSVLLIGIPIVFRSRKYFCFDCSKEFRPGQKKRASQ